MTPLRKLIKSYTTPEYTSALKRTIVVHFLKAQCHARFLPSVFFSSSCYRALIRGPKPFCICLRIRRDDRLKRWSYAASMRPQTWMPRFLWVRRIWFRRFPNRISRRVRSHMRNGFSSWVSALRGDCLMEKTWGRKSRDTVPLSKLLKMNTVLQKNSPIPNWCTVYQCRCKVYCI
jgi:hypothetical protein